MKKKNKKAVAYPHLPDYKRARQILADFNPQNEKYLRSLISNITGNGSYADSLDFRGLRREGFKIRGIVEKILSHESKKQEKGEKEKKAPKQEQLNLFE
tara:strand:- start:847 stop:1143 length:297 start_codon:yes stop_codon:yes gene_type:complete